MLLFFFGWGGGVRNEDGGACERILQWDWGWLVIDLDGSCDKKLKVFRFCIPLIPSILCKTPPG